MTRGLSAGMITAIAESVIRPVYLFKGEFEGSTLYLSSIQKNVSFDSQTWLGNGSIIDFGDIEESSDGRATGWQAILNGADQTLVSLALGNTNQTKLGTLYLGLLDSSEALIADPEQIASGFFDSAIIEETGERCTITLLYENELLLSRRIAELRYTHFSQQSIFPGDDGFEYTNLLEDWSGFWGKSGRTPRLRRKRKQGRN